MIKRSEDDHRHLSPAMRAALTNFYATGALPDWRTMDALRARKLADVEQKRWVLTEAGCNKARLLRGDETI